MSLISSGFRQPISLSRLLNSVRVALTSRTISRWSALASRNWSSSWLKRDGIPSLTLNSVHGSGSLFQFPYPGVADRDRFVIAAEVLEANVAFQGTIFDGRSVGAIVAFNGFSVFA